MGKVLIIKGADFSEVAVAHEVVEPTVFYPVNNNIGIAGSSSYQDGDYWFRCQHGLSEQSATLVGNNQGLYTKQGGTAGRPSNLTAGDFVKIKGAYYTIKATDSYFGRLISPYYGVKSVDVTFTSGLAYKFIDSSTAPSDVSNSAVQRCQVNLSAGGKYVIFGFGSSSNLYTVAIIKKANNTYVNLGDGAEINFIEYTAESGDVLYFSTNKSFGGFVAEVVE